MNKRNQSRREFVKKAAYIPPAVLTLAAAPAFAKTGSYKDPRPGPIAKPSPPIITLPRPITPITPPGRPK